MSWLITSAVAISLALNVWVFLQTNKNEDKIAELQNDLTILWEDYRERNPIEEDSTE